MNLSEVDCLKIVEREWGKPNRRSRDYAKWQCRLHGEKHGTAFVARKDGWRCYGRCGTGGDAAYFIKKLYPDWDFPQILTYLEVDNADSYKKDTYRETLAKDYQPPSPEWQAAARMLVQEAVDNLWSPAGTKALAYLIEQRGLTEWTIRDAQLGYIPRNQRTWEHEGIPYRKLHNLVTPCGILIPNFGMGHLWSIKVRLAKVLPGMDKYRSVSGLKDFGGGKLLGSLYLGDWVEAGQPVLIDEGEFNALSLTQAHSPIAPVAMSSKNARLSLAWTQRLLFNPILLLRFDAGSGDKDAARFGMLSDRVKLVQVPPPYKDPNDFFVAAGRAAVDEWLHGLLAETQCQP